eukprot:gene16288-biopygen17244
MSRGPRVAAADVSVTAAPNNNSREGSGGTGHWRGRGAGVARAYPVPSGPRARAASRRGDRRDLACVGGQPPCLVPRCGCLRARAPGAQRMRMGAGNRNFANRNALPEKVARDSLWEARLLPGAIHIICRPGARARRFASRRGSRPNSRNGHLSIWGDKASGDCRVHCPFQNPGPAGPSPAQEKVGVRGGAGAATEKNEGIAAPQALPGARTCSPTTLFYSALFCLVLSCSVLSCAVLFSSGGLNVRCPFGGGGIAARGGIDKYIWTASLSKDSVDTVSANRTPRMNLRVPRDRRWKAGPTSGPIRPLRAPGPRGGWGADARREARIC